MVQKVNKTGVGKDISSRYIQTDFEVIKNLFPKCMKRIISKGAAGLQHILNRYCVTCYTE